MCICTSICIFIDIFMPISVYAHIYAYVCMLTMCVHISLSISFIEVYCVPGTGLNTL